MECWVQSALNKDSFVKHALRPCLSTETTTGQVRPTNENYTDERQKVTLYTGVMGYFLCCS
jgi:hypothetical protein